jgi:ribose 5-phosphate isomerase A
MATSIAEHALSFIHDGDTVGLGSGRAARNFVRALGARVEAGLQIRGVPTSQATADLAHSLGIPLFRPDEVDQIDIAVDGADEVDPSLQLIKGYGGALVREKIVAASAKRFVILVGQEKLVPVLGSRGRLPLEVLPFGAALCLRLLGELEWQPQLREENGTPFTTDNGNYLVDCRIPPLPSPATWEQQLLAMPGIVGTGLFIDMAHTVLIQTGDTVQVRQRNRPDP